MHPQQAINMLSLLSAPSSTDHLSPSSISILLPTSLSNKRSSSKALGNPNAQAFWLNASRTIDWVKPPSTAYGHAEGTDEVSRTVAPSHRRTASYLPRLCGGEPATVGRGRPTFFAQAQWRSDDVDRLNPASILTPRCIQLSTSPTLLSFPPTQHPTWFPDGELSTCYNALDRHVQAGFGSRPCLHHVSPLPPQTRSSKSMTYAEVLQEVKVLAGVLRHTLRVKKGDRVIVYMPMVLEGAIAMLAIARIGTIHSVVFGGFAPKELAKRIDDAQPSAIIAASCGLEPKGVLDYSTFVSQALSHSNHKEARVLMLRREGIKGHQAPELGKENYAKWLDWKSEMENVRKGGKAVEECVGVKSSDPLYILYTSGTTGMPKGVVRYNGGHAVASRYTMEYTFGLKREDTIACFSDYGWVVGHSFCVYSPMLIGCASVIFEGKPILPDAGIFWKTDISSPLTVVETHKVNCVFTAPTALRAIRREDPDAIQMSKYDLSSLRSLFLAGERSEPSIISRYQALLTQYVAPGAIVNDNYWSTESGSPITALQLNSAFPPLAPRHGSAGLPLPGMDVRIVDDEGKEFGRGEMGNIVLGQPLPPSALGTVWKNEARFQEAYFDRFRGKGDYFDTGDAGVIDAQGFVSVLSRADDLINVAGHRLGTSLLEQGTSAAFSRVFFEDTHIRLNTNSNSLPQKVVSSHPSIAESCVVGLPDSVKGHVPFALVTLSASASSSSPTSSSLLQAINTLIRTDVGSIATFGGLVISPRLPKTRSGKTLRRTVKELVEAASEGNWDRKVGFPPTIEDEVVVEEVREVVNGFFKGEEKGLKAKL
ncbi:BQ2448_5522 [Microbotryum intermedium]|uniref:BQ2448_5522 protein n=1 Tax=Microbotryum intermedium TaxID=269621 RepID=A0A238F757_9BASI|nr:BQ2448_5522 [Microbotryum intermedium]